MQTAKWMLALTLAVSPAVWAQSGGLSASADNLPWARWQGRLAISTAAPLWRGDLAGADAASLSRSSLSLMGDYYFTRAPALDGRASGFRATSGLVAGQRPTLWIGSPGGSAFSVERRVAGDTGGDSATLPYLGVGYSGLGGRNGWSFSADFGLVALAGGNAVRLGRVVGGSQSLDELVRDLRLAPVLQLGVSYSF